MLLSPVCANNSTTTLVSHQSSSQYTSSNMLTRAPNTSLATTNNPQQSLLNISPANTTTKTQVHPSSQVTILAEKLKKLLKQIKYPCNIRSKDLAQGNAVVFVLILEYFLKSYSQVLADFFRTQTKMISNGAEVLSQMKPVSDGGAPSFFDLVLQVFNLCFKYEAPLSVAQFFDTSSRAQQETIVSLKSQILIDILTYGLTYQSQHLAQVP